MPQNIFVFAGDISSNWYRLSAQWKVEGTSRKKRFMRQLWRSRSLKDIWLYISTNYTSRDRPHPTAIGFVRFWLWKKDEKAIFLIVNCPSRDEKTKESSRRRNDFKSQVWPSVCLHPDSERERKSSQSQTSACKTKEELWKSQSLTSQQKDPAQSHHQSASQPTPSQSLTSTKVRNEFSWKKIQDSGSTEMLHYFTPIRFERYSVRASSLLLLRSSWVASLAGSAAP